VTISIGSGLPNVWHRQQLLAVVTYQDLQMIKTMEIEANLSVKLKNININFFWLLSNESHILSRLSNIPPPQKMMNSLTDTIIQSNKPLTSQEVIQP
jgi:hypothetical protein